MGSSGNADDGEGAIISGYSTESRTVDYDVDASEGLPGRAVEYLPGDGPGGLLSSERIEGCRGAQNGTDEQGEKTVGLLP